MVNIMKTINALHVIPTFSARDGGPPRALALMSRALGEQNVAVTIVTTDARPFAEDLVKLSRAKFYCFRAHSPRFWRLSPNLWRWLRMNTINFDVIHIHSIFDFPTYMASMEARKAGKPYIIRPLGTLDPWGFKRKRWKKLPYYILVEKFNLRRANAIHVTSVSEAGNVRKLGFQNEVIIPPAIEGYECQRVYRNNFPLRICFISRLHQKKGLSVLFRSLHILRNTGLDVMLDIAGVGDPVYERALHNEVECLALKDKVRFLGWCDEKQKRDLLSASDIFVLPSHSENFGNAAAEAMMAGLPVVVSDGVALATEIVCSGAGLVFHVGDTGALTSCIRQLISVEARQLLGERGRAFVMEKFSGAMVGMRLRELYESIIQSAV